MSSSSGGVTYQCDVCGRWETVRAGRVGSRARCRDCGTEMTVPDTPDLLGPAPDAAASAPASASSSSGWGPPAGTARSSAATAVRPAPRVAPSKPPESKKGLLGGGLGLAGFALFLILKLALRMPFMNNNRPAPRPIRAFPPIQGPAPARPMILQPDSPEDVTLLRDAIRGIDGPIAIPPAFPDLGPSEEILPGVAFREFKLSPAPTPAAGPPAPAPPGHELTLWLYLPKAADGGDVAPKSVPCVLIAPAGSDMITGMFLAPGDRPEHLPYVEAGFAVLSFSLDGSAPGGPSVEPPPITMGNVARFLRSRAGLIDGRVAIEFLRAKVPQIDPDRLYVAGHSSAARFALLLAENEPSLKGCVAHAPVFDVAGYLRDRGIGVPRAPGLGTLFSRFDPEDAIDRLACPTLLFQTRDDRIAPVGRAEAFAERAKALGKRVDLELVDDDGGGHRDGGHVSAMVERGLPRGVAWLKARDAEVKAAKN